ncbi:MULTISPECIES: lysophospholipid acyltransferase family protein [Fusobacterium]|uniref:lysophospholipid acyltransferase family protein n=1 Tax=Fusobacterium TaxID=848 RepID=UPI00147681D8|nr:MULTISPECIES: lauroyl acyltransferase [Fusobacterium]NME36497.1 lauroyl acyltransferase [Fusobacterium sp. FSA-380-WT-3A]
MKKFIFFIQYILFKFLKTFLLIFPEKIRFIFAEKLSVLAYKLLKSRRVTSLINLKFVFPEKSLEELEKIAIESYKNIGKAFIGTLWLDKYVKKEKNFKIANPEMMPILKESSPATFANMHFGNMEGLLKIAEEFNVVTVGKTQNNPYVNNEIIKNRKCFNITLLQRSPSVGRELVKFAKEGRNIALLSDQKGSGADVLFFSEPTTAPTGVTSIACKFNRRLFLVYCIYQKDFSTLAFIEEIEKCVDETISFKDRVQKTTQNMINKMEDVIRKYPEQWMWMHDRWKFYRKYKKGELPKDLMEFAKTIK